MPGTHKLPYGPSAVFGNVFRTAYPGGSNRTATIAPAHELLRQEAMPNTVKFSCKKGTACAFDTAVYHTALGNASGALAAASLSLSLSCRGVPRVCWKHIQFKTISIC